MTVFFQTLNPILQALIAATIAWAVTAAGASTVFLTREFNRKLFDAMMGFAAGIMLAVCFWSLLEPAVRMVGGRVMPALVGLLTGGLFFWNIDKILPHLHSGFPLAEAEGVKSSLRRSALLVLAITLHNIPEGLAIGVAYGAAATGLYPTTLAHAITLTVGVAIQDFPEGLAVALPLRREGISRVKSFGYGAASALVEPIGAVIGATAVVLIRQLLPYALGFSAGAMLFVIVEELIPESQRGGNTDLATLCTIFGFALMMVLEVSIG
jgi:ZIP family zinc transporter